MWISRQVASYATPVYKFNNNLPERRVLRAWNLSVRAVKKEQLLLLCVVHPFEPKYREREVKNGSDQKQAITLQCSPRHKAAQWGPLMCKVEAGRDGEGERERERQSLQHAIVLRFLFKQGLKIIYLINQLQLFNYFKLESKKGRTEYMEIIVCFFIN